MSRAVVATGYGGPEVLQVVDVDDALPREGEVAIEVRAAGVNPADLKSYDGTFGTDPAALPKRLGSEVSGVVTEVGPGVSGWSVEDEVIAYRVAGGYAERLVAAVDDVFGKPSALSFEQAAGLMLVGVTAAHLLEATGVRPGDTVLLHGASGGVGTMAVQLLVARGARVLGTASPSRHDSVRALGAEPVGYGPGLADRVRALAPDGVDVALDTVGTDEAVDVSIELVADRSRVATIAAFARAPALGIRLLGGGPGADPGTQVRQAARSQLLHLVAVGRLVVELDRAFTLDDVRAAHEHVAAGRARGKVVLVP
ncbi:MAG: NADP-dependent oxidoreductase [Nocardioides sp.]|nr:NADP-dependent oxidoreductase [Nocardioides sp.]